MDFSSFFDYGSGISEQAEQPMEFLPTLSAEDWTNLLAVAERRAFVAGELLIRQGEQSRSFYIVARGELEVEMADARGRKRKIFTISENSIFGEQAFFDGLPRSATVRATQPGELFGFSVDAFDVLGARHPELARTVLLDLGRILSLRLRNVTAMLLRKGQL